jgi:hypothetical protein
MGRSETGCQEVKESRIGVGWGITELKRIEGLGWDGISRHLIMGMTWGKTEARGRKSLWGGVEPIQ